MDGWGGRVGNVELVGWWLRTYGVDPYPYCVASPIVAQKYNTTVHSIDNAIGGTKIQTRLSETVPPGRSRTVVEWVGGMTEEDSQLKLRLKYLTVVKKRCHSQL